MKEKVKIYLTVFLSLVLCIVFGVILNIYTRPMEDVSLDLSLVGAEDTFFIDPEVFDDKGWTVFTCEGDEVTGLTPDGFGGYTGLELGQTFYFSRVMEEELDSPTLKLGVVNRMFAVWLDDALIYTDCPHLDNRIGYLTLPMREWESEGFVIISLPADYHGKVLTIAQSFPAYTEAGSVRAYPTDVKLYCGYAYESELISESFQTAIRAVSAYILGVLLLAAFIRSRDWGMLCLAMMVFLQMFLNLINVSFFFKYFETFENSLLTAIDLISAGALLVFLATRAGKLKKVLWGIIAVLGTAIVLYAAYIMVNSTIVPGDVVSWLLLEFLPYWTAFAGIVCVLVMGVLFWSKENRFYRLFTPTAIAYMIGYWIFFVLIEGHETVRIQIALSLQAGEITYIYSQTLPAIMMVAMFTAVADTLKTELNRFTEKRLLEDRRVLALSRYENMRRQHDEVMMLRHDMNKHFSIMQKMNGEDAIKKYLEDLIGQNQKIRTVVESGNEMLDIMLDSKLSAALDKGIAVDIQRSRAPEKLPLTDSELCSLMINIMDNAVLAAENSKADPPFIRLDMHIKNDFFVFVCENSTSEEAPRIDMEENDTLLKEHGLGLKIVHQITERYNGLVDAERNEGKHKITVILPLDISKE